MTRPVIGDRLIDPLVMFTVYNFQRKLYWSNRKIQQVWPHNLQFPVLFQFLGRVSSARVVFNEENRNVDGSKHRIIHTHLNL